MNKGTGEILLQHAQEQREVQYDNRNRAQRKDLTIQSFSKDTPQTLLMAANIPIQINQDTVKVGKMQAVQEDQKTQKIGTYLGENVTQ